MAEQEQLVLSISADVRQMQRALDRIVKDTQRNTTAMEKAFGDMGLRSGRAFDQVASNSNRAANAVQNNARRMQASMNSSSFATANVAAQLNDIGVQLASGTSPFQIAIQQGTQLNQVFGPAGVRGTISLLGGAFASLVNPVSLATIAIIAAGGYAVQYFSELLSSGQESEETLKEQQELIKRVADRWGEAYPAIKAYADEQERIAAQADLAAVAELVRNQPWEEVRQQIQDARIELADLITLIPQTAETQGDVVAVQRAFEDLDTAIQDGTATTEDAERVHAALAQLFDSTGIPVVNDLAQSFYDLSNAIATASAQASAVDNTFFDGIEQRLNKINEANAQFVADTERRQGLTAEQLRLENEIARVRKDAERAGGYLSEDAARNLAQGNLSAEDRRREATRSASGRSRGGGRSSSISDIDREREAVARLIENLEFEYSLIGASEQEREVANALRRAGSAATDEQRAKIEQLVVAIQQEQEALKQSEEAMRAVQEIGKEFLSGFISDLRNGKDATEALSNALQKVADKLLDMALNNLFERAFGGAGGGGGFFGKGLLGGILIPGILHKGGVAGKDGYDHGRAISPSAFTGAKRYHSGTLGAGLRPDEVPAILQKGEIVLPRGSRAVGGAQRVEVSVSGVFVDDNGVVRAQVTQMGAQAAQAGAAFAVRQVQQGLPSMIADTQARKM